MCISVYIIHLIQYTTFKIFLQYLQGHIDWISSQYYGVIFLCGDFNTLSDQEITNITGLHNIVFSPTRDSSLLDRIYISDNIACSTKVLNSSVKTDHKAVICASNASCIRSTKTKTVVNYRRKSPEQHAICLPS